MNPIGWITGLFKGKRRNPPRPVGPGFNPTHYTFGWTLNQGHNPVLRIVLDRRTTVQGGHQHKETQTISMNEEFAKGFQRDLGKYLKTPKQRSSDT